MPAVWFNLKFPAVTSKYLFSSHRNSIARRIFLVILFSFVLILPIQAFSQKEIYNTVTYLPLNQKTSHVLYVAIKADPSVNPEKVAIVKMALLSTAISVKDGKTTYEGWQGALNEEARYHTTFYMPTNLRIVDSDSQADVTKVMTPWNSCTGHYGDTSFVLNHETIQKSKIMIYYANNIDDSSLATLTLHEFGHALGLGHSTLPGDIMNPNIKTGTFISKNDIQALVSLYDGNILTKYLFYTLTE